MSKRCPECRRINEDTRIFCTYCGATLDAELRLIQDLEKQKEILSKTEPPAKHSDVKFYVSHNTAKQPKRNTGAWVALFLLAAAAVAAWFFLGG